MAKLPLLEDRVVIFMEEGYIDLGDASALKADFVTL